ncbi:MAG: LPS export ABC transporter periplasmic protein LptC [Candidatus Bruticola sp.]
MISPSGRLLCLLAVMSVLYGCGENIEKKSGTDTVPTDKSVASSVDQNTNLKTKEETTGGVVGRSVSSDSKVKSFEDGAVKADQEAEIKEDRQGVNAISLSAKGDSPWSLTANRIVYDDSTKKARASNITWNLLDKNGKSSLELKGDAAVVNLETQGLAFEGPVHAIGPKGENITCTKLIWDSKTRKLRGSHGVKVIRESSVMTGDNMVASPDLKQIEVEGNVRIHFNSSLESN